MKPLNITFILLISLYVGTTYAQQADQWGMPVLGVQLSVNLDTNILSLNSTPILYSRIRNLSTNSVFEIEADTMRGTFIWLTNNLGKSYKLTPIGSPSLEHSIGSTLPGYDIVKDRPYEWSLMLSMQHIIPGDYVLYAERNVYSKRNIYATNYETHELLSNPLSVQVVPEPANLWGESVLGAQLSIALNTNVIFTSSRTVLDARVRNLSTNVLYLTDADLTRGTSTYLTNDSGMEYKLSPIQSQKWGKGTSKPVYYLVTEARPHGWTLDLNVDNNIEPGVYFCYATRIIYTSDHKEHLLKSNFIRVQVK